MCRDKPVSLGVFLLPLLLDAGHGVIGRHDFKARRLDGVAPPCERLADSVRHGAEAFENAYVALYTPEKDHFKLDVLFKNDAAGSNINYLPDGPLKEKILLTVMNLDLLNSQNDPYPDGIFDFLEGITVNSMRGRIIFPVIEPFGSNIERQLNGDATAINKYVFRNSRRSRQSDCH